jgi:integrase
MKIRFYLKTTVVNKAGESPIRCDINVRGTRIQKLIGYSVPYDKKNPKNSKWNFDSEQLKHGVITSSGADYRIINALIATIRSHFQTYEFTISDAPSVEDLNKEFEKAVNKHKARIAAINNQDSEEVIEQKVAEAEVKEKKPKVKPAADYMDEFINEESRIKGWSLETRKMVKSFKNHLIKFRKHEGLDYFNAAGLEKFITYLRSDCGLEENSVEKQYKNLAWFLRWAIRKKYTTVRDIESYEPVFKVVKKPVIFLTQEELDKLYNLKIPANGTKLKLKRYDGSEYEKVVSEAAGMERARDLFCFCAFTSLRYSDVVEVRRVDIQEGTLNITTQKTHDRLPIFLHENAIAILDKYKGEDFRGGRALPYMTNQQMNRCLKDLCEICEFNTPYTITYYKNGTRHDEVKPKYELIGTHAGRKTFICFALSNGIPPDVVMKFTGHCDYKSMKPYIDITESAKKDAIKKMEEAFKKK